MTIEELRAHLRNVHAAIGGEGRLSFTIGMEPGEPCYVTHWVRTGNVGFEDCRSVGMGTVAECLAALERYVLAYRRQPTEAEIGLMLGLEPCDAGSPDRYKVAAE
jgi:hypothetical protein